MPGARRADELVARAVTRGCSPRRPARNTRCRASRRLRRTRAAQDPGCDRAGSATCRRSYDRGSSHGTPTPSWVMIAVPASRGAQQRGRAGGADGTVDTLRLVRGEPERERRRAPGPEGEDALGIDVRLFAQPGRGSASNDSTDSADDPGIWPSGPKAGSTNVGKPREASWPAMNGADAPPSSPSISMTAGFAPGPPGSPAGRTCRCAGRRPCLPSACLSRSARRRRRTPA